jgi:hypothetical protein
MSLSIPVAICDALAGEALAALLSLCSAQVLASEPAKVVQTVDGTTITVEYYRPVARGRELFGGLVEWGTTWTPGANWATTLEVDKDVRLNNNPLPKGKYSIWIEIRKETEWTVMVSRRAKVYHLWPPPIDDEQLRFTVRPKHGPNIEVLTWTFPTVMRDGAELWMEWGTTIVALLVTVEPSRPVVLTEREKAGYVGPWSVTIDRDGSDTGFVAKVEIDEVNGGLRMIGRLRSRFDLEANLIAIGGYQFHPLYFRNGQAVGMEPTETFVFTVEDGRATAFEVRGPNNRPFARGLRRR